MSQQPFNTNLTPAEIERLACIMEECAEVQQIIGKILRHGFDSTNPCAVDVNTTNREMLNRELGDLDAVIKMACEAGDVSSFAILGYSHMKDVRMRKFLHFQPQLGE